ncbi:MAG: DNA polymerase III subunit beta [Patescibacteria group bacterium]
MHIVCLKKYLRKAGLLSEKISYNSPTLPILNAVLISTGDNSVKFSSTNLEISLEVSVPAKIKESGSIAIPSKLFSGLISSIDDEDEVTIESLNDGAMIVTKNSSTTIKGYPVEDFPVLPKIKAQKTFVVSVSDFMMGLRSVYYSTSLSEMKPELNSVFIYSSKNTPLSFVATDTFRLAEKTIPYNFPDLSGFLVPQKSVVEILRVFDDQEEDLSVSIDENNIALTSNNMKFTSRLVEGSFPQYKQLVPSVFTNTVIVEKKDFSNALKSTSMFRGKLNEIKIRIYKNEDYIELQTSNPDLGEHVISITAKTDGDDDLMSLFSHRYLVDFLSSISSDKIKLRFSGEGKSLLVSDYNNTSFMYLVMPIKDV